MTLALGTAAIRPLLLSPGEAVKKGAPTKEKEAVKTPFQQLEDNHTRIINGRDKISRNYEILNYTTGVYLNAGLALFGLSFFFPVPALVAVGALTLITIAIFIYKLNENLGVREEIDGQVFQMSELIKDAEQHMINFDFSKEQGDDIQKKLAIYKNIYLKES